MKTHSKRCHCHHPKTEQHTGHTFISLNPASWKPLCEITVRSSWIIFKRSESMALENIGAAVRITIPGIGTGNPGSILSGYVKSGVSMILP
jgi:hypothetical protein